ncbi:MAG TPA: hypothetical protein VM925_02805 [Labilithrix sp.]|nr:hypothetical protein [Labilithrix sp.]
MAGLPLSTCENARSLARDRRAPTAKPGAKDLRASFVEFMLVGGATLVLFPLAWFVRSLVGLDDSELAIGFLTFYGAYVINDPHFSVTYLLFYEDVRRRAFSAEVSRAQRVRYVIAGFFVPVALVSWAAGALAFHSAQALGWMIQLMFLLVGWHYAKQGFGVLTVLSARRGVRVNDRERKVVLFHCYAGWAFAWANPATAAGEFEEKGVVYRALAHPRWLELTTGAVLALSTIALVGVIVDRWRREGRTLPLAPLSGLLITVWSWTIFSSIDPLVRYVIPALHSIQYLYFVWLMKRNEARDGEGPPAFGRPVAVRLGILALSALGLGLLLFHVAPTFLDTALVPRPRRGAPIDALGETPYFAAIFVFVNVHHYFMDHVIWRRDNPTTRYLGVTPLGHSQGK